MFYTWRKPSFQYCWYLKIRFLCIHMNRSPIYVSCTSGLPKLHLPQCDRSKFSTSASTLWFSKLSLNQKSHSKQPMLWYHTSRKNGKNLQENSGACLPSNDAQYYVGRFTILSPSGSQRKMDSSSPLPPKRRSST